MPREAMTGTDPPAPPKGGALTDRARAYRFVRRIHRLRTVGLGLGSVCVASVLRETTRAIDTPARYGGDEFVVVLPETDLRGAEELGRRVRERLAGCAFEDAPGLTCTVSIGAAEAAQDLPDVDAWINRADAALYQAKALGRDRFVAANAKEDPEPVSH